MTKIQSGVLTGVFLAMVFGCAGASLLKPDTSFSEKENRVLAQMPQVDLSDILNGTFEKNYETYFGIVNTLQSMDRNATYNEILEEEEGNLVASILVIKESLEQLIEDLGDEEAVDYLPVLDRVEKFMEENEIEE